MCTRLRQLKHSDQEIIPTTVLEQHALWAGGVVPSALPRRAPAAVDTGGAVDICRWGVHTVQEWQRFRTRRTRNAMNAIIPTGATGNCDGNCGLWTGRLWASRCGDWDDHFGNLKC